MNRRLANSRWRRLPGLSRTGQRKPAQADSDVERLSLYLPASLLDRAAKLATEAGAASVQAYCEGLLGRAIDEAAALRKLAAVEAEHGPLEGLDAIANDPDYLAEWNATTAREAPRVEVDSSPAAEPRPMPPAPEAIGVILRHAALAGEPPPALLASLRRGEGIDPDAARELLQALVDLEGSLRDHPTIGRRLAFALHRLAFESQVLVTDGYPALGGDPATIETLRLIQEGVDRVLSGDDIRYASPDDALRSG